MKIYIMAMQFFIFIRININKFSLRIISLFFYLNLRYIPQNQVSIIYIPLVLGVPAYNAQDLLQEVFLEVLRYYAVARINL